MRQLTVVFFLVLVAAVSQAQEQDLWEFWNDSSATSTQAVDHSAWQGFLDRYLVTNSSDSVNRVRYAEVTEADKQQLQRYLQRMEQIPVRSLSSDEQFAYWLNLYNALTIDVILEHYPVESIRQINISPGLFARGPWGAKLLEIEGQAVSLDDIEHRILRPIWRDPRIHYGVNCASIGCPNLQPEAFTADNLETLLDHGAREYVNHPRGVTISGDRATVSSIYNWFQEDFGDSAEGVIAHLKRYADRQLRSELEEVSTWLRFEYDWSLNGPEE
jgi:hypothetical protein